MSGRARSLRRHTWRTATIAAALAGIGFAVVSDCNRLPGRAQPDRGGRPAARTAHRRSRPAPASDHRRGRTGLRLRRAAAHVGYSGRWVMPSHRGRPAAHTKPLHRDLAGQREHRRDVVPPQRRSDLGQRTRRGGGEPGPVSPSDRHADPCRTHRGTVSGRARLPRGACDRQPGRRPRRADASAAAGVHGGRLTRAPHAAHGDPSRNQPGARRRRR